MTVAADVRRVLIQAQLPGVATANIHALRIPPNDWSDTQPIILITEIRDDESVYGNDEPNVLTQQAQVQIYYPLQYAADTDQLQLQLKQVMRQAGYRCYSGTGLFDTPDQQSMMTTLKFNHTKEFL